MNALANFTPALATASLDYAAFKTAMTNACSKVVEKRSTITVLSAVLIKATRGGIHVVGTDLDLYTTTFVPGRVSSDFTALIDAHKLKQTMEKVKDAAEINFVQDGPSLVASIGKLNLTLKQDMHEEDFPTVGEDCFRARLKRSNASFALPSNLLATIFGKVEFAISSEETRYYLNGVFMHINEHRKKLAFVTTDGHRLARYEIDVPDGADAMPSGVIIPRKTVGELLRMLKRKGCPAITRITVTDTGISFAIGDDELLESKLVDGTFPDYQRVIPAKNGNKPSVRTGPFIEGIKQASAITSEKGAIVKLAFTPDRLVLTCTDTEFGTASTEVSTLGGQDLVIGFNASYLTQILSQLDGGALLELGEPGDPAIVNDGADDAVTYVLMPARV